MRSLTAHKCLQGVAAISVYTVLGLEASLPLLQRLPHLRWAFPLFLVVHTGLTVVLLRSAPAHIDIQVFLHDGVMGLIDGHNPYSSTFRSFYGPAEALRFYGPGVVVDGQVTYGFPCLPRSRLVAIPGLLFGDVRYSQLLMMLVTAAALRQLASDRIGQGAALLGVASVTAIPVVTGAWTEPTIVAVLACLVLALEQRRLAVATALLGLFLVSKQYPWSPSRLSGSSVTN